MAISEPFACVGVAFSLHNYVEVWPFLCACLCGGVAISEAFALHMQKAHTSTCKGLRNGLGPLHVEVRSLCMWRYGLF